MWTPKCGKEEKEKSKGMVYIMVNKYQNYVDIFLLKFFPKK